jgi:hypothetical protein
LHQVQEKKKKEEEKQISLEVYEYDNEFLTPSSSFGEQGSQSPHDSPKISDRERRKSMNLQKRVILDGEHVKFSDFEIIDILGEGSFGRVFKAKKKDNGQILALKVMRKQYLISNHQIKYAVSEAQIMKTLSHPYLL